MNQYLSIYAADKRTLIPITKLRFIHRYSDLERGEHSRVLFRRSLLTALKRSALILFAFLVVAIGAAAVFSRGEEWSSVRLSDGHTAAVRRAIFSPDGKRVISVGEDSKVIVWDFALRKRIATLMDHSDWVTCVAFSNDGSLFATGSRDKTVIVWDAIKLQKVVVLHEHRAEVHAIAFSPDGRLLASASFEPDNRTVFWSVGTWKIARDFQQGSGNANLLFSPDSRLFISSSGGGDMVNVGSGEVAKAGNDDLVGNWHAVSPDQKKFVVAMPDGWILFWDVDGFWETAHHKALGRYRAHRDDARTCAFSPNGKMIATGSDDTILWDSSTQAVITHLAYNSTVWSVEFSPDGRWLLTTHGDGAILIWDVMSRSLAGNLNEHSGPVRSVVSSSDGKRLATGSDDGSVLVWDATTGRKEMALFGRDARVQAVAFSSDSRWLASLDFYGNLIKWDLDRALPIWTVSIKRTERTLAISPDNRWIVATNAVFASESGQKVVDFDESDPRLATVYGLAFSNDSKWLICVEADGHLTQISVGEWRMIERFEAQASQFIAVSFSPDGRRFVTGDDEGRVRLWSINPLRELDLIGRHSSRVKSVAFSPDGSRVASAGDDRNIFIWDVSQHRLITSVGTNTAPILSITFSADGEKLLSGANDNSAHVFTRHRTLWGYRMS